MQCRTSSNSLALAFVALASPSMLATAAESEELRAGEVVEAPVADNALVIQDTLITAEREARQALGTSIITAEDIKRLLEEKPDARGLVLPGMPLGSPGMEVPEGRQQPYTVELVHHDGTTEPFAQH